MPAYMGPPFENTLWRQSLSGATVGRGLLAEARSPAESSNSNLLSVHFLTALQAYIQVIRRPYCGDEAQFALVSNVVYRRISAEFTMKLESLSVPYLERDFAFRVIQITKDSSLGRATYYAGWSCFAVDAWLEPLLESRVNSLHAEIALDHRPLLKRIKLSPDEFQWRVSLSGEVLLAGSIVQEGPVLIRAGKHTIPAAEALIVVHPHYAIFPGLGGPGRADFLAGCFPAVVT